MITVPVANMALGVSVPMSMRVISPGVSQKPVAFVEPKKELVVLEVLLPIQSTCFIMLAELLIVML